MAITTTIYDESQGNSTTASPIAYTQPTAYDRAKEAYEAAGVFAGDNGRMSKHEQRQWRKLYGINKSKARLMRRAINLGGFDSENPSELGQVYRSAFDAAYMNPIRVRQAALDSSEYAKKQALDTQYNQGFNNWYATTKWNETVNSDPWEEGQSWLDQTKDGKGYKGIQNLQKYLGFTDNDVDGIFGPKTYQALAAKIDNTTDYAKQQQLRRIAQQLKDSGMTGKHLDSIKSLDPQKQFAWANTQLDWGDKDKYKQIYDASKQNQVTAMNKQGGKMNINYFQEGGAIAQQAAPAQSSEQDIQAQVVQLVQAAMQGDQKATEAINQIMSAAKQGDQQALQIAQLIQEVAKQMQGSATSAKYGAKLAYIHSLKTGCPTGYEVSYNKKGGRLCKECVKKMDTGGKSSIDEVIEKLRAKYPQYDDDQLAGRKAIIIKNKKYYMNGDGDLVEEEKVTKAQLGTILYGQNKSILSPELDSTPEAVYPAHIMMMTPGEGYPGNAYRVAPVRPWETTPWYGKKAASSPKKTKKTSKPLRQYPGRIVEYEDAPGSERTAEARARALGYIF